MIIHTSSVYCASKFQISAMTVAWVDVKIPGILYDTTVLLEQEIEKEGPAAYVMIKYM